MSAIGEVAEQAVKRAIPWWVKPAAALVVGALLLCTGWMVRGWHDDSKALNQVKADHKELLDSIEQNRKDNAKENEVTRKLLAPKASRKVNEAVAANPSPCRVPAPVRDAMRQSVSEANAAIRDAGGLP